MKKNMIRLILAVSLVFSSVAAVNVSASSVKQENKIVNKTVKEDKKSENLKVNGKKPLKKIKQKGKGLKEDFKASTCLNFRFEKTKELDPAIANFVIYVGVTNLYNKEYDGILSFLPQSSMQLVNSKGCLEGSLCCNEPYCNPTDCFQTLNGKNCKKINLKEDEFNKIKEDYLCLLDVAINEQVLLNKYYNENKKKYKEIEDLLDKGTNNSLKKAKDLFVKTYTNIMEKILKDLSEKYIKKVKNDKLKKAIEKKYEKAFNFVKEVFKSKEYLQNFNKQTLAMSEAVSKTSSPLKKHKQEVKNIKFKDAKELVKKLKFGPF